MPINRKKFKVEFTVDAPASIFSDKQEVSQGVWEALEIHPDFIRAEIDLGTVHVTELYSHKERTRG